MPDRPLACVVLAAGKGTRLKSRLPKVLHPVAGRPMLCHVLATLDLLKPDRTVVVVGPDMPEVERAAAPWQTVIQRDQRGTADAVMAAREALQGFDGDVLVAFGDTPLVTEATLRRMAAARADRSDPAVVVLGMRPDDPGRRPQAGGVGEAASARTLPLVLRSQSGTEAAGRSPCAVSRRLPSLPSGP